VRRFAAPERRGFSRLARWRVFPMPLRKLAVIFSNVWKIRLEFFQSLENAVSLCSLISTPTAFQVPFSPGSAHSTRRKPSLQTRSPKPPVNSPRVFVYAKASGPFA